MSRRVNEVLTGFSPGIEVYSIDETVRRVGVEKGVQHELTRWLERARAHLPHLDQQWLQPGKPGEGQQHGRSKADRRKSHAETGGQGKTRKVKAKLLESQTKRLTMAATKTVDETSRRTNGDKSLVAGATALLEGGSHPAVRANRRPRRTVERDT